MLTAKEPAERLLQAKSFYEHTWDQYDRCRWFAEVQTDEEYHHGRQWTDEDLAYLRKQRRPALVFNIIQSKLLHLIGAHEDNLEVPIAAPVGVEDQMLADLLNHIRDRIWAEIDGADVDAEVWESGIICGIGSSAIDAVPDPDDPAMLRVSLYPLSAYEVLWDPASERRDRSDARFVFWHRWLSRTEFKQEYPEHAGRIDEIFHEQFGLSADVAHWLKVNPSPATSGDVRDLRGTLYYDRHRDQVRVIRMEYKASTKRLFAVDPVSSQMREVEPEELRVMRQLAPSIESVSNWTTEYRWLEFVGDAVLFDAPSPLPIDGFSITSSVCHQDHKRMPYGKVRMLRDPQGEVNKRMSQTLHLIVQQTQPGVFAEAGAFVNEAEAEASLKMAGSVTKLAPGALAQGKLKERTVPTLPDAPLQIHQQAIRLIDMISGIWSDQLLEPRGIPEAAATAQLKHRQSLLAMRPVMRGFTSYQRGVFRKLLQIVVRAMPDEQIARLLGNAKRYQVQGHIVMDGQTGKSVSIDSMRDLQYNVEVRPADENSSQRLMELQTLVELHGGGMPVDPNVIIDYLAIPSDRKEQLRSYVKSQAEAAAQNAKQQMAASMAQLKHVASMDVADRRLEAGTLAEKARHNKALELIAQAKLGKDVSALMADYSQEEQRMVLDVVMEMLKNVRPPAGGEGAMA